jgi:hypothetical protein
VTVTDSTADVSTWVVFDDVEQQHVLAIAERLLRQMVEQCPADVERSTVAKLAARAMHRARRAFDRGERDADVEHANRPRPRRTFVRKRNGQPVPAETWADVEQRLPAFIPYAAAETSSVAPMSPRRLVLDVEHAGTVLLNERGHDEARPGHVPDVLNRWTRRRMARTDHVAHAAQPRYTPPTPCTYPAGSAVTADGVEHLPTVLRPTVEQRLSGERVGWIGHERATWHVGITVRDQRTVNARKRSTVTKAKRGPAKSVWSISDRAVRKRITSDALRAGVEHVEQILRTAVLDVPLTFGPVTVTVLDGSTVAYADRTYPVRDWCRRAVLDGLDVLDV